MCKICSFLPRECDCTGYNITKYNKKNVSSIHFLRVEIDVKVVSISVLLRQ